MKLSFQKHNFDELDSFFDFRVNGKMAERNDISFKKNRASYKFSLKELRAKVSRLIHENFKKYILRKISGDKDFLGTFRT